MVGSKVKNVNIWLVERFTTQNLGLFEGHLRFHQVTFSIAFVVALRVVLVALCGFLLRVLGLLTWQLNSLALSMSRQINYIFDFTPFIYEWTTFE